MSTKQKIGTLILVGFLFAFSSLVTLASPTLAKGNNGCETDTAIIKCDNVDTDASGMQNTGLWSILLTVINIMTVGVGVLALAGIVYGGILYTSSGGSPEQVKKARAIFTNVVIGVIAFGGMYALLNFIVPGGIFN